MAANLTMVRIATKLDDLFNEKIDISDVKTSDDPDAYPAHIFKNIGRLREIKEQICLRDSKSQEE